MSSQDGDAVCLTRKEREDSDEPRLLEDEKWLVEKETYTPDYVLMKMGPRNRFLLTTVVVSSFAWAVNGLTAMQSAFIAQDCTDCNRTMVTMIQEFDLTGDRAYLAEWTTTCFMIGNMIGGAILSHLADRYGRRPILLACLLGMFISGVLISISPNVKILSLMRGLQGVFYTGCGLVGWVIGYETSPSQMRPLTTWIFGFAWVLGYCLVAPIAYFSPSWRTIFFTVSLPTFLYFIWCYFFVPESLHYLCTKEDSIRKEIWITSARKQEKIDYFLTKLDAISICHEKNDYEKTSILKELWEHKIFIVYTVVLIILWICDNFIYFGLSLYSTHLAGNMFVNYILMGIVEIPAYIAAPIMLDRFGRRPVVAWTHIMAGLCFLALVFTPDVKWLTTSLWLGGKFAISCSYMAIYVYGSEIFPTNIRNGCIGYCDVIARIGCILAPYIGALAHIHPSLPSLVLAVFALFSGVITYILPETLNRPLPSNIRSSCEA